MFSSCGGRGRISSRVSHKLWTSGDIQVKVVEVTRSDDIRNIPYVGVAEASQNTQILSTNSGKVKSVLVSKGCNVKKGQVLAEISSASIQSAYDMSKSTLAQAEDGHARMMQMYEDGGVTELKRIEVETQLAQAQATFMAAANALENCTIRAPYNGVIEEVYVDQGIDITPLSPVMRLSNVHETIVKFPVPENEIAKLVVGEEVVMEIPAIDTKVRGRITVKGNIASSLSHTYECTAVLYKSVQDFLPGMICKVYVQREKKGLIILPLDCVLTDTQGKYVWSLKDSTEVMKTRVEISEFAGGGVIVSAGLEDGDLVVIEGRRKISTGMKVKAQIIRD